MTEAEDLRARALRCRVLALSFDGRTAASMHEVADDLSERADRIDTSASELRRLEERS